ncbi:DUF4254 domain-containing protein [Nocardia sp. NPDC005366]|uniref:DUF4254 domain-containing protein n=1 Tax=Nocardia sp. NPDC005366 TaxID=3156878 RepID=UPI0033B3B21F
MSTPLPSKDMVASACAGIVALDHPVLHAARELGELHQAREHTNVDAFDCERTRLVGRIDEWVAAVIPATLGAAYLHSETVGMIVDRLARLSVDARAADAEPGSVSCPGRARDRFTELADAYGDLAFEIARGTRRLPRF